MSNKLLAMLIREKIKPIRDLDSEWYHNESKRKEWGIIRNVGNAFLDIAEELENSTRTNSDE